MLALTVVLAGCAGGGSEDVVLGGWERVEPGGETRCARGGPYAFWTRRGDPGKLLVFFQGGGGLLRRDHLRAGQRLVRRPRGRVRRSRLRGGGVLDLESPDNPFADYSMVFIPSCTGDVHTGSRVVTYGPHRIEQKGYLNARAALDARVRASSRTPPRSS